MYNSNFIKIMKSELQELELELIAMKTEATNEQSKLIKLGYIQREIERMNRLIQQFYISYCENEILILQNSGLSDNDFHIKAFELIELFSNNEFNLDYVTQQQLIVKVTRLGKGHANRYQVSVQVADIDRSGWNSYETPTRTPGNVGISSF